ncbi:MULTISPECIES: hypothetical protein [Thermus]|nr:MULTISPECIES: hypothetical protein [Thermus]MCS6869600.1 hypothetical protein [Thermus sp.]MCX7850175.1 hypothetical protein [Thermus sp.]
MRFSLLLALFPMWLFALGGGVLALLGFLPLRRRLEEGWRAFSD